MYTVFLSFMYIHVYIYVIHACTCTCIVIIQCLCNVHVHVQCTCMSCTCAESVICAALSVSVSLLKTPLMRKPLTCSREPLVSYIVQYIHVYMYMTLIMMWYQGVCNCHQYGFSLVRPHQCSTAMYTH